VADLKPDLGLAYLRDGCGCDVSILLYDVPFDAVHLVSPGQFSLLVHHPYKGQPHALSFDFGEEICVQLLARLDSRERAEFVESATGRSFPCTIALPRTVRVSTVECTLGQRQRSAAEDFVPFVIRRIE
jgi:hypothetical protein